MVKMNFYEDIIQGIKEFLKEKKPQIIIGQPEESGDKTVIEAKFKEPLELSKEEYDMLYKFLTRGLGFYLMNGAEDQVANSVGYKDWIGNAEFADNDGDKVFMNYAKVWSGGETKYYIKEIIAELNTQENLNELEE